MSCSRTLIGGRPRRARARGVRGDGEGSHARQSLTDGGGCVQLYAEQEDDDSWRLHEDEKYDAPTWKEVCGRASMPGQDNMDAAASGTLRLLHEGARTERGAFYIQLPGYEGCIFTEVCVPRP